MLEKRRQGRPRSQLLRETILKAAFNLVDEKGLQKVSIDAIAAEAHVSKATLYRWWPNKSALLMESFLERIEPEIHYEQTDDPLFDVLSHMTRLYSTYSQSPGRIFLHLIAQAQFDNELMVELTKYVRRRREFAKDALNRAVQQGLLRSEIDIEAALDQLYAPIFYRLLSGYADINSEFLKALFEQVLTGIRQKE